MSTEQASPQAGPSKVAQADRRGFGRFGTRLPVALAALLAAGVVVVALPSRFASLRSACAAPPCVAQQLDPGQAGRFAQAGLSLDFYAAYAVALEAAAALAWFSLAAVLLMRRSEERVVPFAALTLASCGAAFSGFPDALVWAAPAWRLPAELLNASGLACVTLFFYLFPDGRFAPRWTRAAAVLAVAAYAVLFLAPPGAGLDPKTSLLGVLPVLLLLASGVLAQVARYRRVSGPLQRQQTKWVVAGVAGLAGGTAATILLDVLNAAALGFSVPVYLAEHAAFNVAKILLPLSIGVAILRYRLWEIDVLVNRALVYAALTACVVGVYVLVVGYLGAIFRTGGNLAVSLVATGVVAVLFAPLRDRLQRGVNRLMYGERDDPYAVLSRLGERLEAALEPRAVLPTIAETVAQALKLPYAAVELETGDDGQNGSTVAAEWGFPVGSPIRLPLVYGHETVGHLLLAPRAPGEAFGPADNRLLSDLARQAGVAAHAVHLTADLQRARERLVSAREEERRRLRRDLHDGLGPQLSGQALTVDAARALMRQDPDAAEALLLDLKAQALDAVADVRRLVHDLRPPALDDLGLVDALRQAAARYHHDELAVRVEAPKRSTPLPAAVEVAVYRIALEAMINVVRHAGASECAVRLAPDETSGVLILEVRDDGRGLPAERTRGVGLSSMRERAEELGGDLAVDTLPEGGACVRARLPLPEGR